MKRFFPLGIVILMFAVSIYLFPQLPGQIASQWGIDGEVNSYMPKTWGVFLLPVISVFLWLLFMAIPKIDPLKNIKEFRKHYDLFILMVLGFLLYIHILTLVWNLHTGFNMTHALVPAIAALFYYIGNLLEHTKRNWFIGIRTPWTLSSDEVWNKTHKLGGLLFKIKAGLLLTSMLFPEYFFYILVIPVLTVTVCLVVYSYVIYTTVQKR